MESVGALCDLTHFVAHPEQGKVFVIARAVGRFKVRQLINDKPFVTAIVTRLKV